MEYRGDEVFIYFYSEKGEPIAYFYRDGSYADGDFDSFWLEKNLQGDIVAVYSEDSTKLVSYTYDAWGNFTTTYHNGGATTPAAKNPFLYRGYYYDSDMQMYYVQNRFYDQSTGRFISPADSISDGSILGSNMFLYANNNPIMRKERDISSKYASKPSTGKILEQYTHIIRSQFQGDDEFTIPGWIPTAIDTVDTMFNILDISHTVFVEKYVIPSAGGLIVSNVDVGNYGALSAKVGLIILGVRVVITGVSIFNDNSIPNEYKMLYFVVDAGYMIDSYTISIYVGGIATSFLGPIAGVITTIGITAILEFINYYFEVTDYVKQWITN